MAVYSTSLTDQGTRQVDASHHLKPEGTLAMVMSDQSDIALITNLFRGSGWIFNDIQMEVARSASGGTPHVRIVWLAKMEAIKNSVSS